MALVGPILGALYLVVECMHVSESASISMPGDSILFKVQTFFFFIQNSIWNLCVSEAIE